jgi:hypothetical protein
MLRCFTFILIFSSFVDALGALCIFSSDVHKGVTTTGKPSERVLVQTDREVFIAGENLFYSIRLMSLTKSENNSNSKIVYLAIRNSENKVVINAISKIANGGSSGAIYLADTLHSGIYQLLAYTNQMRNSDEIFYFRKNIYVANRFDKKLIDFNRPNENRVVQNEDGKRDSIAISHVNNTDSGITLSAVVPVRNFSQTEPMLKISTDKKQYKLREKISAELELTSVINDSIIHFAISVAESASLNPLFISDNLNQIQKQLLTTERDNTGTILPDKKYVEYKTTARDSIEFLTESSGYILKGKLIDIVKNMPVPGTYVMLSTPDTIVNLDYSITDAVGQFYFLLSDYYEGKKLILNIYSKTGNSSNFKIEIEDKFDLHLPFLNSNLKINPALKDYIIKSQEKVGIQKVYEINTKLVDQFSAKPSVIPVIYSSPQYTIFPDEYTEFPDLIEMSKNIIPGLRIRKENNSYKVSLLGMDNDNNPGSGPAIFLDGVLIDDVSRILNLGSEKISKIEMIKSAWFFGDIEFHGIVSIFSKKNEIDKIQLSQTSHTINIGNYARNNQLRFPDYSTNNTVYNDIPDFRQLLYWHPEIRVKPGSKLKIEFFSSDISGKYLIKAFGITSNGNKIESEYEIIIGAD